jgi:hypothetical protein
MKPALLIGVVLALTLPAAPLQAADITVPGGSLNGIEDAIRDAGTGGTVTLGRGLHRITETVTVDVAGVLIRAKAGALLQDVSGSGGDPVTAFLVTAPNVRISNIRMEGDRDPGSIGVDVHPAAGTTVRVDRCEIFDFETGIRGDGEGVAIITKNHVERCTNGIDLAYETTAVNWEVSKNRIRAALATGIFLGDGDGTVVRRNDVRGAGTDGMNLGGVFLVVERNRTRLNAGYGLFAATNSCNYISNKSVRNGNGIRVQGTGNRLVRNRGKKNTGDGVIATGGNAKGEGNRGVKNGGTQVSIS